MTTFSINFQDDGFDERPYQDALIQRIGSEHHRVLPDAQTMAESFPAVVCHAAQPLLRTAPVPMFLLSRLVRERNFKVVLTGEGADEILAGYNIFKENRIRRFWSRQPASTRRPRLLSRIYPYLGDVRGRAGVFWTRFFGQGLERTADPFYSHRIRWTEGSTLGRYLQPDLLQSPFQGEEQLAAALPARFMAWDPLAQAQYLEIKLFLPGYLLSCQGDRMMMAHSVEGRFPFLDHRVVEFANALPAEWKLNVLNEKFILKKAFRNQIPEEILTRPKQPYRAPSIARTVLTRRCPLMDRYLSPQALASAGIFNPPVVGRLVDKLSHDLDGDAGNRDNMAFLAILSTQIIHQHMICRLEEPCPPPLTTANIGI
jgi:asparagine synthase (glutamine-hydrolysing)